MRTSRWAGWMAVVGLAAVSVPVVEAQIFESVGTRALGMGGAFVAVADDATATYWNPAGLASGPFVSVVVDGQIHEAGQRDDTSEGTSARTGDAFFVGLATPPLGLTYYRLRSSSAGPPVAWRDVPDGQTDRPVDLRSLVTHHWAATIVQTLVEGLTVAASVKLVRGVAADGVGEPGQPLGDLVDDAAHLDGRATTTGDVDLGALAVLGRLRLGVVARNLTAPAFETPSGGSNALERQVRAGAAVTPTDRVTLAFDADLTRSSSPWGERRMVAAGGEGWWFDRRLAVRAGVRASTVDAHRASGAVGVSVAAAGGFWIDAQITRGGDNADRAWGVSARVGF